MKISKLFHWLYALLMLMPVFFIGFTCCYVVFNDNAFESYYGETINEENVNYLSSSSDTDPSVIYYYESSMVVDTNYSGTITYNRAEYVSSTNTLTSEQLNFINSSTRMYFYRGTSTTFYDIDNNSIIITGGILVVKLHNVTMAVNTSGYRALYYLTYNKYSYLDDVFEYSLDKLEDSPYFSWAYDSFLVSPFRYIGNLFSVPSNSVIYLFLSYWLDISIIYLVFDMVMYVPLLVHRWLDKGVLE